MARDRAAMPENFRPARASSSFMVVCARGPSPPARRARGPAGRPHAPCAPWAGDRNSAAAAPPGAALIQEKRRMNWPKFPLMEQRSSRTIQPIGSSAQFAGVRTSSVDL
jgi:hypothetical protein